MFVDLPHWILYDEVSKDLQGQLKAFEEPYQKAEEDVEKGAPHLFREFVESDNLFREALIVSCLVFVGLTPPLTLTCSLI